MCGFQFKTKIYLIKTIVKQTLIIDNLNMIDQIPNNFTQENPAIIRPSEAVSETIKPLKPIETIKGFNIVNSNAIICSNESSTCIVNARQNGGDANSPNASILDLSGELINIIPVTNTTEIPDQATTLNPGMVPGHENEPFFATISLKDKLEQIYGIDLVNANTGEVITPTNNIPISTVDPRANSQMFASEVITNADKSTFIVLANPTGGLSGHELAKDENGNLSINQVWTYKRSNAGALELETPTGKNSQIATYDIKYKQNEQGQLVEDTYEIHGTNIADGTESFNHDFIQINGSINLTDISNGTEITETVKDVEILSSKSTRLTINGIDQTIIATKLTISVWDENGNPSNEDLEAITMENGTTYFNLIAKRPAGQLTVNSTDSPVFADMNDDGRPELITPFHDQISHTTISENGDQITSVYQIPYENGTIKNSGIEVINMNGKQYALVSVTTPVEDTNLKQHRIVALNLTDDSGSFAELTEPSFYSITEFKIVDAGNGEKKMLVFSEFVNKDGKLQRFVILYELPIDKQTGENKTYLPVVMNGGN